MTRPNRLAEPRAQRVEPSEHHHAVRAVAEGSGAVLAWGVLVAATYSAAAHVSQRRQPGATKPSAFFPETSRGWKPANAKNARFALRSPLWGGFSTIRGQSLANCRRHPELVASIEASQDCAEAQRSEYFMLMPSKELPKGSLDLRAWASKDRDNVDAEVFARQEGTVPSWRNVGVVATVAEDLLTEALAKQRKLIVRWAYELCNDFETNERLMQLEGPNPIEIAWAIKPAKLSLFDSIQGKKQEKVVLTEVPPSTEFAEDLRCGFLGGLARKYRGGGVSARTDRIVIGKDPEVPLRLESQKKYDSKYSKKKTGLPDIDARI
jgi:hypothetical protein